MAELRTIARPYAEALFELAQSNDNLAQWSEALGNLSAIADNPDVEVLIGNPNVETEELAQAITAIAGESLKGGLGDAGANLVKLLAENERLSVLPEIAAQYEDLRAKAEGRVDVVVTSAVELNSEQQAQLTKSLKNRLKREISLTCTTDAELIGGLVVRAGDLVIDGSLRASLARMQQLVSH